MSKRSLKLSIYDVFFFSTMVGVGESYLPAFALSVGMSETMAGFFASVPLILAAIIQLLNPIFVQYFATIQRYVVFCVVIQALSFLPLIYLSLSGTSNFVLLFLIATIYWGAGFAAGPAWNFWMGYLVPQETTADYFSQRTRWSQIGVLLGLMGGGFALHYKLSFAPMTSVFSILFLLAFIARASSALILARKDYRPEWYFSSGSQSLRQTIQEFIKQPSYREFFGFLFLFYVAVFMSAPFVSPFFLKKLNLDYFQYMVALSALFIAKIAVLPWVPKLIKKYSLKKVLLGGAFGLSPLPIFWSLYHEFWFVILLQACSGIFWACFEVALTLVFFQQLKHHEKIPVLTIFNLFNSLALIVGATLGAQILHSMNESFAGYFVIFILGSIIRLVLVYAFAKRVQGERRLLYQKS